MGPNNQVLYNLQDIFNLLPNLNLEGLARSMVTKTSDMHLLVYLAALIRSVTSLHDLVNNKIAYCEIEEQMDKAAASEGESKRTDGKSSKKSKGAGAGDDASEKVEEEKKK